MLIKTMLITTILKIETTRRSFSVVFLGMLYILVFAGVQGCSISAHVSDSYIDMAKTVPFRAEQPIAREIKFVYASGNMVSGIGGGTNFLVATNLETTQEVNLHGISYIKQKYPGVGDDDFIDTSQVMN